MAAPKSETKLQNLQRRVAELESRLDRAQISLDRIPVLISYVNRHQRYEQVNQAYEEMFGIASTAIIGRTIRELTGEEHYARAKPYIDRALAGEAVSFNSIFVRKDGARRDIDLSYTPDVADGGVRGFIICIRDTTAERRASAALREREQDLRSVLDNVPDIISRYGPDLRLVFTGASIEKHLGKPPRHFTGKTHQEMGYPAELCRLLDDNLRRVFETQQTCTFRFELPTSANTRQYEAMITPEFGESGEVESVLMIADDITGRLRAERQLLNAIEQQSLAVQAGKVGLWSWDIRTNRVEWSDQVYAIHGKQPGSFGATVEAFAELVHLDDRDRVAESLAAALAGKSEYHVEFRATGDDGLLRWIFANARVVFEEGQAVRMLGAVLDITESKKAAEELQRVNEDLRRANEDLNQFAFSASHDLREPLRTVSLYCQMIKRKYAETFDSDGLQYLEYAVQGSQRIEELVRDLLSYTQSVNADANVPIHDVDMNQAVNHVLDSLKALIEENRATITFDRLPVIRWREVHARQVLLNLLTNALKYRSPEHDPRIHVGSTHNPLQWTFSVRDNGIGIDPRYHEKIFGIFKRLHSASKYKGTGIGLAICQKVVERNGGRIWVASRPGNGATFYFTCPA